MLSNQINAWLLAPDDYEVGLSLLRETGYTGFTLTILSKGADAYNRSRLESELRKWLDKPNTILPLAAAAAPGPIDNFGPKPSTAKIVLVEPHQSGTVSTEPAGVNQLRNRSYRLMDERAELKARLRAKMDDESAQEERRDWAFRIKAITRELDELYSQLDFFEQYGYLPPVAADPAVDVDDTAALMNMRSYVSRYKGKLKKTGLTPEQRQTYADLLAGYEAEKQRLELKLKRTNDSHSTGQQTTDSPNHSPLLSPT